jgi:hypothetical protein
MRVIPRQVKSIERRLGNSGKMKLRSKRTVHGYIHLHRPLDREIITGQLGERTDCGMIRPVLLIAACEIKRPIASV